MKRLWLEELRKDQKCSQSDIGKQLGITRQAYTHIETGTRNPSLFVALRLSLILGFDPLLFLDKEYSVGKQVEAF